MTALNIYDETLRSIKSPMLRKIFINSCYPLFPMSEFRFNAPREIPKKQTPLLIEHIPNNTVAK